MLSLRAVLAASMAYLPGKARGKPTLLGPNLQPGTYWVTAKIDWDSRVDEANENNNILSESFTVLRTTGDLNATVKEKNDSTIENAVVKIYEIDSGNWIYMGSSFDRQTNAAGVASWMDLEQGSYGLEAYHNEEYWVSETASVVKNQVTEVELKRNEPYAYDFKVYNANTNVEVTGGTVASSTPLRYEVKVQNDSPVDREVGVKLWVDREKDTSYDFYEVSSSKIINGKNYLGVSGKETFVFNHTTTGPGTYFRMLEVETFVLDFAKTDSWNWGDAVTVEPQIASQVTNVSFDKTQVVRGSETITATVTIQNTGNDSWTFYVGGSSIKSGGTTWYNWSPSRASITLGQENSGSVNLSWSPSPSVATGTYGFYSKIFKYNSGEDYLDDDWKDGAFSVVPPVLYSSVSGKVYNASNGSTISGALVQMAPYSATSAQDGSYVISNIAPGDYTYTVSKTSFVSVSGDISIPPNSPLTRNFTLSPISTEISVANITCKYKGNPHFLDGVDFNVNFTANIDWAGHTSEKVVFITSKNLTREIATSSSTASATFNMGNDFGAGGKLRVHAISGDGTSSPEKEANFVVMHTPSFLEAALFIPIDQGNDFYYMSGFGAAFSLISEGVEEGVINENIPLFGGKSFNLNLIPPIVGTITSDGKASFSYEFEYGDGDDVNGDGLSELNIAGFNIGLESGFYILGSYNDIGNYWEWAGLVNCDAYVDPLKKSWPFTVVIGVVPIPMYAKAALDLCHGGPLNFDLTIDNLEPLKFNGLINIQPYVRGSLGVGADEMLAVEGWIGGGADFSLQWPNKPTVNQLVIYLDAGVTAYVLLWSGEKELFRWDWDYYDSPAPEEDVLETYEFDQKISLKPASREYTKRANYGAFLAGKHPVIERYFVDGTAYFVSQASLQTDVFPYSEPDLSSGGTCAYLAWLYDDPNRSMNDRTVAVFSSFDGNVWSQPVPIDDDGTADFHPDLIAFGDGSAVAAWESEATTIPDSAPFEDMKRNLEIKVCIYDPGAGQWLAAQSLTSNTYLDRSPKLSGSEGNNVMLVWISNENNHLVGSTTDMNRLWWSTWDGTTWSAPQMIMQLSYGLLKYNLVYDGTEAYLVMSLDTDNSTETIDDHELYALHYSNGTWGALARLTDDTIVDDNPNIAVDPNGHYVLTWLRGNELSSVIDFSMTERNIVRTEQEYSSNLADYRLAASLDGKLAIVWAEPSEYSSDIWGMFYDPIFQVWGNPKQLSSDSETEKGITTAFHGADTILCVYDRTEVTASPVTRTTPDGKELLFAVPVPGATDLYMLKYTMGQDLALEAGSLTTDLSNPIPGEKLSISARAINMGDAPANNVPVAFYLGGPGSGGAEIGRAVIPGTLIPGASAEVFILYDVPIDATSLPIYALIDPEMTFEDNYRLNNMINEELGIKPDLAVTWATWEGITNTLISISARVTNQGSLPCAQTSVTMRKDSPTGEVLFVQSIDALDVSQSVEINFNWDTSGLLTEEFLVYIIVDEAGLIDEFEESNNVRTVEKSLVVKMMFEFNLGYNLVSVPFYGTGIATAEDFAQAIPNCVAVWRWDAMNQSWSGHPLGGPNNFALEPGGAYLVNLTDAGTFQCSGTWATPVFQVKTGYNLISLPKSKETLTTAEGLAQDIPNCTAIWKWDAASQTWSGHPAGGPNDFAVEVGQPYLINVSADSVWP